MLPPCPPSHTQRLNEPTSGRAGAGFRSLPPEQVDGEVESKTETWAAERVALVGEQSEAVSGSCLVMIYVIQLIQ